MGEGVRLFFGSRGSAPRTPPSGGPPGALPRAAPAGLSEGSPRAPAAGCQEHGGEGEGTEDRKVPERRTGPGNQKAGDPTKATRPRPRTRYTKPRTPTNGTKKVQK